MLIGFKRSKAPQNGSERGLHERDERNGIE